MTTSLRAAILQGMNRNTVMLDKTGLGIVMELIQTDRKIEGQGFEKSAKQAMAEKMAVFLFADDTDFDYDRPYLFANNIAMIPIQGLLLNRLSFSGWGVTGYDYIRSATAAAMSAGDVHGVIYDINSPGGMVSGNFELADYLKSMRDEKPMMGMVNGQCCSGSYSLGSAIGNLTAMPSSDIGSIGVLAMHMDYSGMMEKMGIKPTFVFAGDHKVDGNPYEPLTDSVKADWQKSVDADYDKFVTLVADNRDMEEKAVRNTEARIYSADEALSIGLIDSVATVDEAMAAFTSELSGSINPQGVTMSKQTNNPAGNNAAAENENTVDVAAERTKAVAADRQRRKDILSCEEAKEKQAYAGFLADDTEMSVEEAKKHLKHAAVEKVAAVAANDGKGDGKGDSDFNKAMSRTQNPGIQDDEGGDDKGNEANTPAARTQRLIDAGRAAGVKGLRAVEAGK